jgi:hypothetical protein
MCLSLQIRGHEVSLEYKGDQVRVNLSKITAIHIKPAILNYLELEGFMVSPLVK